MDGVIGRWPNPVCLALVLEQVFATIRCEYIWEILHRFSIPGKLIDWIRLLYTDPTARVKTGGYISTPYDIQKGTRQGCPLSPILFALVKEPLAARLRELWRAWGIPTDNQTYIVSLYADDMLVNLRDVTIDLTEIAEALAEFPLISGLRVNYDKSHVFPLQHGAPPRPVILNGRDI